MRRLYQIYYTTKDDYFASFYYYIDRSNDRDLHGEGTFAEYICRSDLWGFDKLVKE